MAAQGEDPVTHANPSPPVRLLIAENENVVRETFGGIVEREKAFDLVATAATADEAVIMASQYRPDVALVDVNVPGGGGVRAAVGIRTASPLTRVLAVSAFSDPEVVSQMLQAGALGYFLRGAAPADLVAGLHRALEGQPTVNGRAHDMSAAPADLDVDAKVRARWEQRGEQIREVIQGDRLSAVYQPIFDLRDRRVVGAEALARFGQDSPRPTISWFREAEDADLLAELELEAIRRAISAGSSLAAPAFLSVNLSPKTILAGGLPQLVPRKLAARLVVEIADHATVTDYAAFARALAPLRKAGVRLAVDDFGSGASSLRHVLLLAPDIVKLDIKLTRGIHLDLGLQAIAAGLIAFAQKTGATVIAEGIETDSELYTLRALGADLGQGYLLARPMVAGALKRFLGQAGSPARPGATVAPAPVLPRNGTLRAVR